jgi:hypothetical protein
MGRMELSDPAHCPLPLCPLYALPFIAICSGKTPRKSHASLDDDSVAYERNKSIAPPHAAAAAILMPGIIPKSAIE